MSTDRRDIGKLTDSTGGTVSATDAVASNTTDDIATIVAKLNALIEVVQKKIS